MRQIPRSMRSAERRPLSQGRLPIDLGHLSHQTFGDPGLECEVLRMFDAAVSACHERLRDSRTPIEAKAQLYAIATAATGIGAFGLAGLARAAEAELDAEGSLGTESLADLAMGLEEVSLFIADHIRALDP
jgi:hypothetical protein